MSDRPKPITRSQADDEHQQHEDNLALLAEWAFCESSTDRGGTDIEAQQAAWRAAARLLINARESYIRIAYAFINDAIGGVK